MISYFKNFGFSRLPVLLIFMLLLRLPMLYIGMPLTIPELSWLTIGEKLGDGFIMYRDVWDNLEPLSASAYYLIDLIFGKSVMAYRIIALVLVFIQAVFINQIYNMNQVREKTTLPALFYVVFSFLYFDFLTLSPMLMGLTFILLVFYYIFYLIKTPEDREKVLYLGIAAGIATLFYYPAAIFLFLIFLALIMYTPANLKKVLLLFCGFLLPFGVALVYFFWLDGLQDFYYNLIISPFTLAKFRYIENETLILVSAVPFIIMFFSFLIISGTGGKTNYQTNVLKIIFLYLLFAAIAFFLIARTITTYQLYIFIPAVVFYSSFAIQQLKKKRLREFSFWFSLFLIVIISYGSLYDFAVRSDLADNEELVADREAFHDVFTDKSVWTTGGDRDFYLDNYLGMPYLNMMLAERHFARLHDFQVLGDVYENFHRHSPEVIIDQNNIMPDIFRRIPILEDEYRLWSEEKRIYIRTDVEVE